MSKWTNGRTLWVADKERVADDIYRAISKGLDLKGYKERHIITDSINDELDKYTLFKDEIGTEGQLFWRIMLIFWLPTQFFILVPYCAIKWLFGYGWYLKSGSLLSRFHRRIFKNF